MTAKRGTVIRGTTDIKTPWDPCEVTKAELNAIHALVQGKATEDQQFAFIEWFKRATGQGLMEFHPAGERESNFESGKRFVGRQFFILAKSHVTAAK
jgi:hypothetical protein